MTIMLGFNPGSRAATTARRSSSADTQITTASQFPASSLKLANGIHRNSWASAAALSAVRFHTPVSSPRTVQAARHVRAHGAQSDESCLHTRFPVDFGTHSLRLRERGGKAGEIIFVLECCGAPRAQSRLREAGRVSAGLKWNYRRRCQRPAWRSIAGHRFVPKSGIDARRPVRSCTNAGLLSISCSGPGRLRIVWPGLDPRLRSLPS